MKEVKYIPLDLVKADKNPNIIWKVKDVSQDKRGNVLYRVVAAEDNDAFIYLYEHQIAPVPLTPEILEKNGWDKEEKDGSDFSLSEVFMGGDENEEGNYNCFQLYYQNETDGWVIDMRGEPLKFEVRYIHELQHLFFGLGINHEMEV